MTQQSAETITFLRTLFQQARGAARKILGDERIVAQWGDVDIDRYRSVLTVLGINHSDLALAMQNIHKNARAILQDIVKWENRLSNLEADIRLGNRPERDTAAEALLLKSDCRDLPQQLDILRRQDALLSDAAVTIRKHLDLGNLLTLATVLEDQSKKSREIFDKGLLFFRLVTDNRFLMANENNIHRLTHKAEKLEKDLDALEFPRLPELARVALRCRLDTCRTALKEILLHAAVINRTLLLELRKIHNIEEGLKRTRENTLAATLARLEENARKLRSAISEFEYKSHLIKEVQTISLLLDNLTVFLEAFRDSYLPHLSTKIQQVGSPLNPHRLAEGVGKTYFNGFKGLFRLLKLLLAGGGADGPLNEQTVAEKISIALTTCPYYYCTDHHQGALIDDFIDSLLIGYAKPFPYSDLLQLIRDAIATYGERIEKDFSSFTTVPKTDDPNATAGTAATVPPPGAQLGRLINKIEVRALQLNSHQHDRTPAPTKQGSGKGENDR
ncbi:MAG: hypothetical protein ACOY32_05445 [Thermodesulfobacteriota bacterium]